MLVALQLQFNLLLLSTTTTTNLSHPKNFLWAIGHNNMLAIDMRKLEPFELRQFDRLVGCFAALRRVLFFRYCFWDKLMFHVKIRKYFAFL
jgi:hypothetical protein